MEPTLVVGDHLLVNAFLYGAERWGERSPTWLPMHPPRRREVVVFRWPPDPRQHYVKRCAGRPGENLTLHDGALHINGQRWTGGSLSGTTLPDAERFGPFLVPARSYFVLGDHLELSSDSRAWGVVPSPQLIGRAQWIYWSPAPPETDAVWSMIDRTLAGIRQQRWGRLFHRVR